MTENNLENRVSHLEAKVSVIETKVDSFIQEMRDFKTEMRDRDNRRAAEIAELREQREKDNAKHDADMREIRSTFDKMNEKFDSMNDKIEGMSKHVHNLTIAAMIGIGAMAVSVVGFVISVALK